MTLHEPYPNYTFVLHHIKVKKRCELDKTTNETGHYVIRLPPYYCQYNALELVWVEVEEEVALLSNTFSLSDATLVNEATESLTKTRYHVTVTSH